MKETRIPAGPARLASCLALAAGLAVPARADLTNRWSFNSPNTPAPAGTALVDSVGTATGSVVGLGAEFSGGALVLPGTTNGNQMPATISAYADLPNGLISSKTHLTIELWVTPQSVKSWQRIFDFGRMSGGFSLPSNARGPGAGSGEILPTATQAPNNATSSDDFALAIHPNGTANAQRLMARLNGATELGSNSTAGFAVGTQHHVVCTFTDGAGSSGSAGGQIAWYLNGTRITTLDVNFHLSSIEDRNNWLGRSMYSADSNSHIAYNEVRLYNHALSPAEIAANLAAGPDNLGEVEPDPAPVPDNVWAFTTQAQSETPSGRTFTDSKGGKVATLRGNGASLTGGALVLPGSTTGNQPATTISAYLDLPNGIVSETPSVSFEAWASPLSSKTWQRLFDFGRCVGSHGNGAAPGEILDDATAPGGTSAWDNLSLTFNNADNINSQQLEGEYDDNGAVYSFSTAATTPGTRYHYVLVVEDKPAGCQARWYRNGALQNSMDFAFHINEIEDVNNWIGRSMYSGDSNSHLSLDELRIYRRVITPGEILASFTAGPDPTVGPPEPPAPVPVPSRRWDFNAASGNAPAGTTFLDTAVGEIATVRGHGATLTGSQLVLPSTATNGNQSAANISAYLDLPNGIVSARPSVSFEAWATPLSSKNWQRLFDFGSASLTSGPAGTPAGEIIDGDSAPGNFVAADNLFLSLNNGGTLGSHRLEAKLGGGATVTANTDYSSVTTANTQYHYVLTVQDGGGASGAAGSIAKWYRNGVLSGTIDLPYRVAQLRDVNNWIGRSMWAADSNSHFSLNELRIYDRAISTAEVKSSYEAGATATFPPPVAVNDSATIHAGQKVLVDVLANDTGGALPGTLQIANPPSAGTATVTGGRILYAHSGSASPVSFTYRVGNVSGSTATATVTVQISNALRLTNPALAMPAAPPTNAWQLVEALPGLTFNQPLAMTTPPGESKRLFVCERMAKIQHVPDVTAASPVKNVFLDLQAVVAGRTPTETIEGGGNAEHGLLGLAFHPQYATNGYFYVAYTVRISGGSYYQRISRFKVSTDPTVADPASELILLNQLDRGSNHDGGDLHFGPQDGYLYYTAGDEENPNDFRLNSQKINKDFFCGIFRFDVDKKPGNLEPNPHAAIPTDNGIARFSVPIDNPFVHTSLGGGWDGTYNGNTVSPLSGVRTEFWATGLRHTWRMSFDPVTGDLWGGDVGQDTYEEVNRIVKGGNYGWVWREGKHDTAFTNPVPPARPAGFTSIDPVYEYVHTAISGGDASFKGNSVVGGYVYRGSRFPDLVGSYIFSDSVSGHVWKMDTATGAVTRLTGLPGAYGVFSAQGVDPFNQDLYFAAYLTGKIMRLTSGTNLASGFPATLSATGLFADLSDLSPAPGLLPYVPNLKFWSDHADKTRWFTIPDAAGKMTWSKDGNWTFPTGAVWVKHFDLNLSRGNPTTKKRIETRVLVKTDGGTYGVSYRWNDAQTEATLVEDAGVEFDIAIDDHGTPHTQRWQIPGRSSCLTCHTPEGGHVLSFNTRQLNRQFTMNGFAGNQLDLLSNGGFLTNSPAPVATLPRHVRPDETGFPLEQRARSWLAVNCSYCHQENGSVAGFWDGRPELTLEQTGLIHGVAENPGSNPLNRYVVPGSPVHSIILSRAAGTNGFSRMPPLATSEVDTEAVALLTAWINENASRPLYQQWRDGFFAAADPLGDKSADPDGDGVSNYHEYLRGSPPTSGAGSWNASIADGNLTFLRKSHRYYSIQTSDQLGNWQPWPIPELESSYKSADELIQIPLPAAPGGKQFFRFRVTEP